MTTREYADQAASSFAIFCDEAGLDYQAGLDMAEEIARELESVAADREHAPGYDEGLVD